MLHSPGQARATCRSPAASNSPRLLLHAEGVVAPSRTSHRMFRNSNGSSRSEAAQAGLAGQAGGDAIFAPARRRIQGISSFPPFLFFPWKTTALGGQSREAVMRRTALPYSKPGPRILPSRREPSSPAFVAAYALPSCVASLCEPVLFFVC